MIEYIVDFLKDKFCTKKEKQKHFTASGAIASDGITDNRPIWFNYNNTPYIDKDGNVYCICPISSGISRFSVIPKDHTYNSGLYPVSFHSVFGEPFTDEEIKEFVKKFNKRFQGP